MGMAASQARLLCITARISDVEFQAQSIQHAKLQLATQSDQAYKEYIEALDVQSLVLRAIDGNSGEQSTVTATFNNLCSRYRLNPAANNGYEYDEQGKINLGQWISRQRQNTSPESERGQLLSQIGMRWENKYNIMSWEEWYKYAKIYSADGDTVYPLEENDGNQCDDKYFVYLVKNKYSYSTNSIIFSVFNSLSVSKPLIFHLKKIVFKSIKT